MNKVPTSRQNDELYKRIRHNPFIIAGPCVLESYSLALECALQIKDAAEKNGLVPIFKSSFEKANRTSLNAFKGPGMVLGLEWLQGIHEETGLPILTDIHEPEQAAPVAKVANILQIPAFLCRQTNLLLAAGKTGAIINVKKGQFLSPWDMRPVLEKIESTGNSKIILTERGSCFGYNNLVVDMRSFSIMNELGMPVVMDATHAVQTPGGLGSCSGGDSTFVPALARGAVAAGAHGIFLECHPQPKKALCDGPNSLALKELPMLLKQLAAIWEIMDGDS